MNETVAIAIPVSPEAAALLRQDSRRLDLLGDMISRMMLPTGEREDPLLALLDSLPRDAAAPELSPGEIAAEIAAARADRRR